MCSLSFKPWPVTKHGVNGNDFKRRNFEEFPDFLIRAKKAKPDLYVASIVHWEPIQKMIVLRADVTTSFKTDAEGHDAASEQLAIHPGEPRLTPTSSGCSRVCPVRGSDAPGCRDTTARSALL